MTVDILCVSGWGDEVEKGFIILVCIPLLCVVATSECGVVWAAPSYALPLLQMTMLARSK